MQGLNIYIFVLSILQIKIKRYITFVTFTKHVNRERIGLIAETKDLSRILLAVIMGFKEIF